MNEKTIATIALPGERLSSLESTLLEARRWIESAAAQGADLVVLPETINLLHRSNQTPLEAFAIEDWRQETAMLCEAAAKSRMALVLPLLVRDGATLANRFYLLARDGAELGHYQKRVPAAGEQATGVEAGATKVLHWEGLTLGGAICIDVYFPQQVLEPQVAAGAELFVIPSMTPAGISLEAHAVAYGVPMVLAYSPWSRIVDRDGRELAAGGYRAETLRAGFGSPVVQATINFDAVTLFADFNQEKMRDVQRHYGRKVRVRFNQPDCVFLLESVSEDVTVNDVMKKFGLISRRDYLQSLVRGVGPRRSSGASLQ